MTSFGQNEISNLFQSFDQDSDNLLSETELMYSFKIGGYDPYLYNDYVVQKTNGKYSMDSWLSLLK